MALRGIGNERVFQTNRNSGIKKQQISEKSKPCCTFILKGV